MGKFRDGMAVTTDAVSLILMTLDRVKEILGELERNAVEPEGSDFDLIGGLERMATEPAPARPPEKPTTAGTVSYQVLERSLRPGEVSLDDLERAFLETPGPEWTKPEPRPATIGRFGQLHRQG